MNIKVNPHYIEIKKQPINEKEINVSKCQFEFSEEITEDYVKEAYFTKDNTSYKVIINNNECDIPYEVLEEKGQIELGVVAYLVENEQEIKRYNPSPIYFDSIIGSLKEQYENTEPITPSDKEQIEQAILNLQNNKQDTLVSGENIKTLNNESLLGSGNIEIEVDLSNYYTKAETYSKGEVNNLIPTKTSDLTNDSDYTTKTYVDSLVGDIESILTTLDIGGGLNGN